VVGGHDTIDMLQRRQHLSLRGSGRAELPTQLPPGARAHGWERRTSWPISTLHERAVWLRPRWASLDGRSSRATLRSSSRAKRASGQVSSGSLPAYAETRAPHAHRRGETVQRCAVCGQIRDHCQDARSARSSTKSPGFDRPSTDAIVPSASTGTFMKKLILATMSFSPRPCRRAPGGSSRSSSARRHPVAERCWGGSTADGVGPPPPCPSRS